jgi:hypothetical protein
VKADDPVFTDVSDESQDLGVLDAPLEPVIGLAEGETRWRGHEATRRRLDRRPPDDKLHP